MFPLQLCRYRVVFFFLVLLICGGCGQKGDLYLPDKSQAPLSPVEQA